MHSTTSKRAAILAMQPLYLQIKDDIRANIVEGTYKADDKLPSEHEMVLMYNASRTTIRQSIKDLQNEGLVYTIPGKGTFISRPKVSQTLLSLQGFGEAMSPNGHETYSTIISQRYGIADKLVQNKLRLTQSQIFELQRIRYLDREPISLDVTYLPSDVGSKLENEDLTGKDLFMLLESRLGIALGNAEVQLEAILAGDNLAHLLNIEQGSPILRMERLAYTSLGVPLDFEYLYYRGDYLKYSLLLSRHGG